MIRKAYGLRVAKERAWREQFFGRLGVDHVTVRTAVQHGGEWVPSDYVRPLSELFRRRQKRMKGYG